MPTLCSLTILDVGHGSCTILRDGAGVIVIDTGLGGTLQDYLEQIGVTSIDSVLISHADEDHIGGLVGLLSITKVSVASIYLNPEHLRGTEIWQDFLYVLGEARKSASVTVHTQLTTASSEYFVRERTRLEILTPTPEMALAGPGNADLQGRALTFNSLSAVIRIIVDGEPQALVTGDVDGTGLQNMIEAGMAANASILLFPHHGGLPGRADPVRFTEELCAIVRPETVIFSIGRGKYDTPRPEIVRVLNALSIRPYVACTQLSTHCSASPPATNHVRGVSKGRSKNACCAGTIEFSFANGTHTRQPTIPDHRAFIDLHAATALCLEEPT